MNEPRPSRLLRAVAAPAAAVMAATVALAGCGATVPAAATVNGRSITRAAYLRELSALQDNRRLAQAAGGSLKGEGRSTFNSDLAARWLSRLVVQVIVDREFARRHLQITPDARQQALTGLQDQFGDPQTVQAFPSWFRRRLVERSARLSVLQASFVGPAVSDEEARAYFAANQESFTQVCVSHILVPNRNDAVAIANQLAAGGDFATLARQKSKDPGSAAQGGSLGCNPRGRFVKEFDDAAFSLPVGKVSDPVQTQFGFHLILVTKRQTPDFASARSQVVQTLSDRNRARFDELLTQRIASAHVTVDPRFGRWVIGSQGPQVQAPQPPVVPDSPATTAPGGSRLVPGSLPGGPGSGGAGSGSAGGGGGGTTPTPSPTG